VERATNENINGLLRQYWPSTPVVGQNAAWARRKGAGIIDAYDASEQDSRGVAALLSAVDGITRTRWGVRSG
jgi:hypothetical protein